MKCHRCQRPINPGQEASRRIEIRQGPPDPETGLASERVFGMNMADGKLADATGPLKSVYHQKCYYVVAKADRSRTGVSGYDQAAWDSPEQRAQAGARARELAHQLGTGSGDTRINEIIIAERHNGPYAHRHTRRLPVFQVPAHLRYAHGQDLADDKLVFAAMPSPDVSASLHASHDHLHVIQERERTEEAKRHDPGHRERLETDWREQETRDVGDVPAYEELFG